MCISEFGRSFYLTCTVLKLNQFNQNNMNICFLAGGKRPKIIIWSLPETSEGIPSFSRLAMSSSRASSAALALASFFVPPIPVLYWTPSITAQNAKWNPVIPAARIQRKQMLNAQYTTSNLEGYHLPVVTVSFISSWNCRTWESWYNVDTGCISPRLYLSICSRERVFGLESAKETKVTVDVIDIAWFNP